MLNDVAIVSAPVNLNTTKQPHWFDYPMPLTISALDRVIELSIWIVLYIQLYRKPYFL